MSVETVARRYAVALADVIAKNGDAENVRKELRSWEFLISASSELQGVFGNPSITHSRKEGILEGLIQKARASETTANFLRVLLTNGRLGDLSDINERLAAVLEERSNIVSGKVISAHELADAQRQELEKNLETLTGKNVTLHFETDTNIIGGVITRIGSTVYDSSVRTKLENLREQLVNA